MNKHEKWKCSMNKSLYEELRYVRRQLKIIHSKEGKMPVICSDDALMEMARLLPRKMEDLLTINGIGQSFVDKYGKDFMKVFDNYHARIADNRMISGNVSDTLKNLEQRLINISKRNRLLYMGKIYNKYAYDLFSNTSAYLNGQLLGLITGDVKSVTLCEMGKDKKSDIAEYKKLNALIRELDKDYRETGEYDAYIGYPYIVGRSAVEDFAIHAPLMLLPVAITKTETKINIRIDNTKDTLLNNQLIILKNKLNGNISDLPNNVVDEITTNYIADIKEYFASAGIEITGDLPAFSPFPEYTVDTFPKMQKGEYRLENVMVLGKFSMYSTALQRDYRKLRGRESVSVLVSDLLESVDNHDIYEDADIKSDDVSFSDENILYVSDLDYAQTQAIMRTKDAKELVVQGPPGTGKSQTIVNMISDAVNDGKTVLMVSQKKAALDVIMSRLGTLSDYAIMLSDTKNKEEFYKQLSRLIYINEQGKYSNLEYTKLSRDIDGGVEKLDDIARALFAERNGDMPMYQVYIEGMKIKDESVLNETDKYYAIVDKVMCEMPLTKVVACKDKFLSNPELNEAYSYLELQSKYKWLEWVRTDLGKRDFVELNQKLTDLSETQEKYLRSNIFYKVFHYKSNRKHFLDVVSTYFTDYRAFDYLYKHPVELQIGLAKYENFEKAKIVYDRFDEDEKAYLRNVYAIGRDLCITPEQANKRLYDFVMKDEIDEFEFKHRETFVNVENYKSIVQSIISTMEDKKAMSRSRVHAIMSNYYYDHIAGSKRYGDISRIVDSKRKWSINKFIDRFGFELFKGIRVWLMTPEVVSELLPLDDNLFDLLIFDEASQIYIERGIPAIARATSVVVAGDHKQLRPSSLGVGRIDYEHGEDDETITAALEEESLLDLARFKYPQVMLNFHYRSKYEELIDFSNHAFYSGRLIVSPNVIKPSAPPIEVVRVKDGKWTKRANTAEAERVVALIKEIFASRKKRETMGVITFNIAQRDLILDLLDEECANDSEFANIYRRECTRNENGEDLGFFVKNIENVQGDERDIIIFSLAYARNEDGKLIRNFGWLNQVGGENRLNVAISRAKQKIYIVSTIEPNELEVDDLKNDGPKLFKKYLEYAFAISDGNTELAKAILQSICSVKAPDGDAQMVRTKIKQTLENNGYVVEENIGIGGYNVDLAIKGEGDKYVLGIDIDSSVYSRSLQSRESDISRYKYLKSRGWNMYRLWTKHWYDNPIAVVTDIEEALRK